MYGPVARSSRSLQVLADRTLPASSGIHVHVSLCFNTNGIKVVLASSSLASIAYGRPMGTWEFLLVQRKTLDRHRTFHAVLLSILSYPHEHPVSQQDTEEHG